MFRRRRDGTLEGDRDDVGNSSRDNVISDLHGSTTSIDLELQGQAQEVMKDNLEMMKDIVMRIREDPEFARGIYKNCPRLQHLLEQYPDLRPIFEDPKLIRLNFEKVYRDAGGVLPEDEKKKRTSWLIWFINSPIFKILKLALFVKRLVACIMGGGFAFVSGCLMGCCYEDALEELDTEDPEDIEADTTDPNKEALNRAADHMEDPEVQEQMQRLLDDPENMQEAIENDPELRALRDSNPLCEELMSDPETMRVLTDPDNLRALGEAPSLIEADFADPNSFVVPDADVGTGDVDGGYDPFDGGGDGGGNDGLAAENDFDADEGEDIVEDELIDEADGFDGDEGDDGWWEDAEVEAAEAEGGDRGGANAETANARRSRGGADQSEEQLIAAQNGEGGTGGRFGGIMASIGVMATDLIAAQIVGSVFGDDLLGVTEMLGGGGDEPDIDVAAVEELDGAAQQMADIEEVGQAVVDTVEDVDEQTGRAQQVAEGAVEVVDAAEAAMEDDGRRAAVATGVGIGVGVAAGTGLAAAGGIMAVRAHRSRGLEGDAGRGQVVEEEFVDEGETVEPTKKNRFGLAAIKSLGTALATAAMEHVTTSVLGDDLGEQVIEGREGVKLKKKEDADEEDEKHQSGLSGYRDEDSAR